MEDEVNIVDNLAITLILVFVPEVYYGIRDNKEVFYKNQSRNGIHTSSWTRLFVDFVSEIG